LLNVSPKTVLSFDEAFYGEPDVIVAQEVEQLLAFAWR